MEPFETLIEAHGAHVWRVCRALTGPDDADDAWQETFLAALRAYPHAAPTYPRAWLASIAHHKCMDIHRRRARDPVPVDPTPLEPGAHPLHGTGRGSGHGPERSETGADGAPGPLSGLWSMVATLAPKQRQVIAYRYFGGLPYQDIAEILGGTAQAARRAGSDGLANLRKRMNELEDDT